MLLKVGMERRQSARFAGIEVKGIDGIANRESLLHQRP
jgi:hypothetical protein